LDFSAHHHEAPLGYPFPKFKVEFSDTVARYRWLATQ
jgi:hypothetical protein